MHTPIDPRLVEEAERFRLRFSCDHCAYFDDAHDRCSEGFPHHEHRSSALSGRKLLVFCKSFELS